MISNHGLTLESNEFNGVKALERRGFFVFWVHSDLCGVFGWLIGGFEAFFLLRVSCKEHSLEVEIS